MKHQSAVEATARTWEDNADEARVLHHNSKDARLAVLIATSVEPMPNGGARRGGAFSAQVRTEKCNMAAFAERMGCHHSTVQRYIKMWDKFAEAHPEYARENLSPADAMTLVLDDDAQATFDNATIKTKAADIAGQPGAVATAMADPAFAQKVIDRMPAEAVEAIKVKVTRVEDDTPRDPVIVRVTSEPYVEPNRSRDLVFQIERAVADLRIQIHGLSGRSEVEEIIARVRALVPVLEAVATEADMAFTATMFAAWADVEDEVTP